MQSMLESPKQVPASSVMLGSQVCQQDQARGLNSFLLYNIVPI